MIIEFRFTLNRIAENKNIIKYIIFLFVFLNITNQVSAVELIYPSQNNLNHNSFEAKISIIEPNLDAFKFNWNSTNYSFYDSSLVLAMNFNNNAAIGENSKKVVDISKYRHNGTIYGATWTTKGRFGGAMIFDGVDDYVNIPSVKIASGSFTIEGWINPKRDEPDDFGTIVAYDSTHRFLIDSASGQIKAYFGGIFNSKTTLPANQWTHILYMWNSSNNTEYWYINGNHDAENIPLSKPVWNDSFQMGKYISGEYSPDRYKFHGIMDEFRIWKRTLSSSEIKMHFQSEFQKYNSNEWKFYENVSWSPCGFNKFGCNINPTTDPIGGGVGYSKIIKPSSATYIVSNRTSLLSALSSAVSGNVIYVNDNAKIDLTNDDKLIIPAGVTLASGRGRDGSKGGLIYTNYLKYTNGIDESKYFFITGGNGVRITGIRLEGPDKETRGSAYQYSNFDGIYSTHDVEVDNSELSGWSHCAVCLYNSPSLLIPHIHHNYIHHNRRKDLGYGVVHAKGGNSITEANIFDWNRHSIAGDGEATTNYTARYNLILGNGSGHSFDMHGGADRNDGTKIAGGTINIYSNTFYKITNFNYPNLAFYTSFPVVKIRGIPSNGAKIFDNYIYYDPQENSIQQINAIGNMNIYNNCYSGYLDHIEDGTYTYYGWARNTKGVSNSSQIRTITVNDINPSYDIDGNGYIDILDLLELSGKINQIAVAPYQKYDMNGDGTVNILDFTIVTYYYNNKVI